MIRLGALLVVAVVAAIVYGVVRASRVGPRGLPPSPGGAAADGRTVLASTAHRRGIEDDLARWRGAGLLSDEQAAAILAYERSEPELPLLPPPPAAPRSVPVVAEALGYLGGVLALVGLGLVVARYWPDMATGVRLGLSGGAAAVLVGAGALVHEEVDPALARLRGFLWLTSTAAAALFAGVLTADAFGVERVETVVLACAGAVTLESGLLWWWRARPLQQLSFISGLALFVGVAVDLLTSPGASGLAVWLVGATFVALGLRRRTPLPWLSEGAGAVIVVVGAITTASEWQSFGLVFAVLTAAALLAVALVGGLAPSRADQLLLGVIGSVALVQTAPGAIGYFGEQAGVVTGLVTWVCGACLVVVGARRLVRLSLVVEGVGAATMLAGAALTGIEAPGFASIFGAATAVGLVGLGMVPGQVLMSLFGSIGLLVNVPWAISWYFPGEGRAPLLILVAGLLILAVAVLMARMGGRFRRELGGSRDHPRRRPPAFHGT